VAIHKDAQRLERGLNLIKGVEMRGRPCMIFWENRRGIVCSYTAEGEGNAGTDEMAGKP